MAQKTSKEVQNFYNEIPFPDYELKRFNSKEDLKLAMLLSLISNLTLSGNF